MTGFPRAEPRTLSGQVTLLLVPSVGGGFGSSLMDGTVRAEPQRVAINANSATVS